MRMLNLLSVRSHSLLVAGIVMLLVLPACSVNVNKGEEGEDKKVDIETPMGGLHVSDGADVREVGLSVYPGAKPKPKDDSGDEKSANVNLSLGGIGLKVVAVEYLSDDPPDKILAYYTTQLKKYGKVLQCAGTGTSADIHIGKSDKDSDSDELTCGDSKDKGSGTELKAGSKANQRIVSVKPNGKGSDFALVYVRTHGKDTI
jgi:hypothetical protein